MKYPNPTFLKVASKVKHTRRNRTIVIIVCLCLVTAIVLFVMKMASMQEKYRKDFPQLVGAATSTTEETTKIVHTHATTTTTTTTPPTETTEETTVLAPSFVTTTTTETTESTVPTEQVNSPDLFQELDENVYFYNTHPLQTVSHDLRDQYLDDLKQYLEEYIDNDCTSKERVCIYYINLSSNETMGVNELSPIVPAGAFNLPIEIAYYDLCYSNIVYPYDVVTYQDDAAGNSSYISDTYTYGKQFYLRTLANYAIARNDNVALNLLVNRIGGMDFLLERINKMSCYVNYGENVIYTNNVGTTYKGPSRSSCYDMATYAKTLYLNYKNNPSAYQQLINDLAYSALPTGYAVGFGEDALILHVSGRSKEFGAYTDVAIIDDKEPIAICIYCECASEERAQVITADLSSLVAQYINSLH